MLKLLFSYNPEVFYTINIIRGFSIKNIPLLWIIGGIFSISIFIILIFTKKANITDNKFRIIALSIILIFWLPLYLNFFYSNIYDFIGNLDYYKYDLSGRRIIRLCDMDHYQNIGGIYCRIFSFIQFTKNILPEKQTIKIIAYPSLANYLQYYFYPYFNLTDKIEKADYLVYYFPIDYNYQNNFLYSKGQNNQEKVIGEYFLVGERGAQELILKKIKE